MQPFGPQRTSRVIAACSCGIAAHTCKTAMRGGKSAMRSGKIAMRSGEIAIQSRKIRIQSCRIAIQRRKIGVYICKIATNGPTILTKCGQNRLKPLQERRFPKQIEVLASSNKSRGSSLTVREGSDVKLGAATGRRFNTLDPALGRDKSRLQKR